MVYPLDIVKTTMQVMFNSSVLNSRDKWPDRICYTRTPFKLLRASSRWMGFAVSIGTSLQINCEL